MEAAAREARGARSCLNGQESDTGESVAKGPSGGRQSALLIDTTREGEMQNRSASRD